MNQNHSISHCIESLIEQGNLKRLSIKTRETHLKSQMKQLVVLNKRSVLTTSSQNNRFLHTYDALFRVFEIALIKSFSVYLIKKPHQTFKKLIFIIFPSLESIIDKSQIEHLVKLRHNIKKKAHSTSQESFDLMYNSYQHCLKTNDLFYSSTCTD